MILFVSSPGTEMLVSFLLRFSLPVLVLAESMAARYPGSKTLRKFQGRTDHHDFPDIVPFQFYLTGPNSLRQIDPAKSGGFKKLSPWLIL
jgi:hypothetical protein